MWDLLCGRQKLSKKLNSSSKALLNAQIEEFLKMFKIPENKEEAERYFDKFFNEIDKIIEDDPYPLFNHAGRQIDKKNRIRQK
jgi:hypothetical protein